MKPKVTKPPTLQDLFEKIRELQKGDDLQENDLTVGRVMKEFNWGRQKSRRYLVLLEERGTVKKERIFGNGGKMTDVWRPK